MRQRTTVQKYNTERRRLIFALIEILNYIYFIELLPLLLASVPLMVAVAILGLKLAKW